MKYNEVSHMNILTAENLSKSYTDRPLFQNISFGIHNSDKIGIIGVNGTGKSTLLKILAGIEIPDEGKVTTTNGLKINYLPQSPDFKPGTAVIDQVFQNSGPVMRLIQEYEQLLPLTDAQSGKRVLELSEKIDQLNAWGKETEAKTILTKLGITDYQKDVGLLSGGQKKRVAMAAALLSDCELLIMDEPTKDVYKRQPQ